MENKKAIAKIIAILKEENCTIKDAKIILEHVGWEIENPKLKILLIVFYCFDNFIRFFVLIIF